MSRSAHSLSLVCSLALASAFPLTAQRSVTLTSSKDNTLYDSPTGALSNGAGTHFFSGLTGGGAKHRGLIAFDVASVIPAGSRIVGVELTLAMSQTTTPATTIALHAATADWGEGTSLASGGEGSGAPPAPGDATWLHRFFSTTLWSAPGGDFASTPSGSTAVAGIGSYTWASTAQMVADVQRWLDTPSQSWGWLLLNNEASASSKRFDTKDHPTASARPRLVIQYLPKASVAALGTGCAGVLPAAPVHAAVGLPVLGNATFALAVSGGPASAPCTFVFATAAAAVPSPINPLNPSCLLYLDAPAVVAAFPAMLSGAGAATLLLPVPNLPAVAGGDCFSQVGIAHLASPGVLLVTNALVSTPGT